MQKEFIELNLSEIIPYERNNKIHTEKDIKEIAKSIKKNWYVAPIIVDEKNVILAGHWRLLALQELWIESVKVLQVSWLSSKQKKDYRIRDNTTNFLSDFDMETLKNEIDWLWDFSIDLLDNLNFDKLEDPIDEDLFKMDTSINDFLEDGGFRDSILKESDYFSITFVFEKKHKDKFQNFLKIHTKEELTNFIINQVEKCQAVEVK